MSKTKVAAFVVPPGLRDRLKIASAKEGRTMKSVVVEAVQLWLDYYEHESGKRENRGP